MNEYLVENAKLFYKMFEKTTIDNQPFVCIEFHSAGIYSSNIYIFLGITDSNPKISFQGNYVSIQSHPTIAGFKYEYGIMTDNKILPTEKSKSICFDITHLEKSNIRRVVKDMDNGKHFCQIFFGRRKIKKVTSIIKTKSTEEENGYLRDRWNILLNLHTSAINQMNLYKNYFV